MSIIYLATNKINFKRYVGFTTQGLRERKRQHKQDANNGSQTYFHRAIKKCGIDEFEWKILFGTFR